MRIQSVPFIALALLGAPAWSADGGGTTATPPVTAPAGEQKPFLGIQVDASRGSFDGGVVISAVLPNSSASSMGIQAGDVITAINKQPLASMEDLQKALTGAKVGDTVTVDLKRKDEKLTVSGQLQAKPAPPPPLPVELENAKRELEKLKAAKAHEPSLAEMLDDIVTKLDDLDKNLPKAAEAFKKQYPNGEFSINISITISSDKNAKNAVQLGNQGDQSKKDDQQKKDGEKKDDATGAKDQAAKDATPAPAPGPKPPPAPPKP